jgi:hypothetical protein
MPHVEGVLEHPPTLRRSPFWAVQNLADDLSSTMFATGLLTAPQFHTLYRKTHQICSWHLKQLLRFSGTMNSFSALFQAVAFVVTMIAVKAAFLQSAHEGGEREGQSQRKGSASPARAWNRLLPVRPPARVQTSALSRGATCLKSGYHVAADRGSVASLKRMPESLLSDRLGSGGMNPICIATTLETVNRGRLLSGPCRSLELLYGSRTCDKTRSSG